MGWIDCLDMSNKPQMIADIHRLNKSKSLQDTRTHGIELVSWWLIG